MSVGYAGRSQRRMPRVIRSAVRLSSGGIDDLRVECVSRRCQDDGRILSFFRSGCWAPCTMGATRPQAPCTDYLAYGYALSGVFVFRPVSGEPVPAA